MPNMEKIQALNLQKERDERLITLTKDKDATPEQVRSLLTEGANVLARDCRAMLNACKKFNYPVINVLIEFGALSRPIARKYIGSLCDYRGFDKTDLNAYFDRLESAIAITGADDDYFEPYLNNRAAVGDMEGLTVFKTRFGLTDEYVVRHVLVRIIFEVINHGYEDVLAYVSSNRQWIDQSCFDLAVSGGEEKALEYILDHSDFTTPSRAAVATALFAGHMGVLDMLSDIGYDFEDCDEYFLAKACRATMTMGMVPLEYLLEHGYSLEGSYCGKTVLENALADGNFKLAQYIREKLGIKDNDTEKAIG